MYQTATTLRNPATIGEEISHELGARMIKDFQDANPDEIKANYIGRNILEQILAQPDCAGICFFNGINEMGKKSLVYVGVDSHKKLITEYTMINTAGQLTKEHGIVADRSVPPDENEDGFFFGWFD